MEHKENILLAPNVAVELNDPVLKPRFLVQCPIDDAAVVLLWAPGIENRG